MRTSKQRVPTVWQSNVFFPPPPFQRSRGENVQPLLSLSAVENAPWSFADTSIYPIAEAVARGIQGAGGALPYLERIQSAFGGFDVSGIRAHTGPDAAAANRRLQSAAYTFGERIAFGTTPTLHTAAHEAAHVVQQRKNIGRPGDAHEIHADAVADMVSKGVSAAALLDRVPSASGSLGAAPTVQMQWAEKPAKQATPASQESLFWAAMDESIQRWIEVDKIKAPLVRAVASEYVQRPGRFEIPDRIIRDTPFGGDKVIPGVHEPGEQRVYDAIYPLMNIQKIGKGDKASDWKLNWGDEPAPQKKSGEEKLLEIGKFGAEQAMGKLHPAMGLATEYGLTGTVSKTSLVESISEPVAKWVAKDVLLLSAEVTAKAIPVIGWLWLAYDVLELASSLSEPAEKELSPYQMESASIVAGVKAFLAKKNEAPLRQRFFSDIIPLGQDKTQVRRH